MSPIATVAVATYRRPGSLAACIEGLRSQTRPPDEVLVVVHSSDDESKGVVADLAAAWDRLRSVTAEQRGTVEAYNRALLEARGAIVAYVDDDAVPAPDWLERIVEAFELDERIAAVGGRDVVVMDGQVLGVRRRLTRSRSGHAPEVGRIQWFGRVIANHHAGTGAARDVDLLKGVNMSFRRSAVIGHGFDKRLRGEGATVHSELSICLPLRARGLRVIYDPRIVVMHYPAPRLFGEIRGDVRRQSMFSEAHNEALAILEYFSPLQRIVFTLWGLAVGATGGPGLVVLVRDLLRRRPAAWQRFWATQQGRASAWRTRRIPRPAISVAQHDSNV